MKAIFHFDSAVVGGRGKGAVLGFPTANLGRNDLEIDYGVYVCRVNVAGEEYAGALNYGPRPTFDLKEPVCEIFLLDFSGDLYGKKVGITVYNKIRKVRKFGNAAKLKEQIEMDVAAVREFFLNQTNN